MGWVCLAAVVVLELVALWRLFFKDRPRHVSPGRLDQAAEELPQALREQYDRDERLSRIRDPIPIHVRWAAADPLVTDHWRNIRRDPAGGMDELDEPLDVQGRFEEIAGFFAAPAERLAAERPNVAARRADQPKPSPWNSSRQAGYCPCSTASTGRGELAERCRVAAGHAGDRRTGRGQVAQHLARRPHERLGSGWGVSSSFGEALGSYGGINEKAPERR